MSSTKSTSEGSVLGGILLVSGCCIGAGMLGMPVLSALAGFGPSSIVFFLCWIFVVVTGLILLEANLWFKEEVNIVTIAGSMLGTVGKVVTWFLFLYLFYSLLVAYVAGSGDLLSDVMDDFNIFLDPWIGSLVFALLFGCLIYCGTRVVDLFNRLLMFGLVISYFAMIFMGLEHIEPVLLSYKNWNAAYLMVPAMIISFGYQNLIPSLKTYLKGDVKKLITIIMVGSFIPLVIYLVWNALILGIVSLDGFEKALDQGDMATRALKAAVDSPRVVLLAEHFAFFAIVSSFLSVALSFVDFLSDGLHIKKTLKGRFLTVCLSLVPPFLCALLFKGIFLNALRYAGAYGAVILYGILPALIVWVGRYHKNKQGLRILPGGRFALGLMIIISAIVVMVKLCEDFYIC